MSSLKNVPVNRVVLDRLEGVRKQLVAGYQANSALSSATKGAEREDFVRRFLAEAFPTLYRFGSGDITDAFGTTTGQIDLVIEYPHAPSLATLGGDRRLYFAENVVAVIEVKSDLRHQREEILNTAARVNALRPDRTGAISSGLMPAQVPFFVVGYCGWANPEPLGALVREPEVDAVLQLDSGAFACKASTLGLSDKDYFRINSHGMLPFLDAIRRAAVRLLFCDTSLLSYVVDVQRTSSAPVAGVWRSRLRRWLPRGS